MESHSVIRRARATLADATALLHVERQSLAESPYSPDEILRIIRRPEHFAYLARIDEIAVGFCSCIEVPADGGLRLEIDMLGVSPEQSGRGIGAKLIAHSTLQAERRGVPRFRAVVSVDNLASQRAFRRAGLEAGPDPVVMLVFEIRGNAPVPLLPPGWHWHTAKQGVVCVPGQPPLRFTASGRGREVHSLRDRRGNVVGVTECLQVHTIAYRGLWVEKLWATSNSHCRLVARALVERTKTLGFDEVGYLLPRGQREKSSIPLIREGFLDSGSYLLFTEPR